MEDFSEVGGQEEDPGCGRGEQEKRSVAGDRKEWSFMGEHNEEDKKRGASQENTKRRRGALPENTKWRTR